MPLQPRHKERLVMQNFKCIKIKLIWGCFRNTDIFNMRLRTKHGLTFNNQFIIKLNKLLYPLGQSV